MPDKTLEEIINRILQVITPDKIILFGSRARGEASPDSDYDLMIVKEGVTNTRRICGEIYQKFYGMKVPVDVLITTPEKLEKYKNTIGYVYKQVVEEGIVVYE
jgi:uncharacterized protein